jgi:hypothetical protein
MPWDDIDGVLPQHSQVHLAFGSEKDALPHVCDAQFSEGM